MEWENLDICQDEDGFWRHTPNIIPARLVQVSPPPTTDNKVENEITNSPSPTQLPDLRIEDQVDKYALVLATDPIDLGKNHHHSPYQYEN